MRGAARAPIRGPKRLLALRGDDRLVELVRAGDAAAFEVLYERHVAGLLGFCRHMLGSQEEAEDAVQRAFVSAHDAIRRGTREIAFKPWLYTIARNRCLSMLRGRREQPAELPELSTAGLNREVEQRADLRELLADVQRLPEQQRAALVLSELGDLSHAEVAEVIGQEPKAVKGLVFRARAALAERRDARAADCADIRVELASATGGGLRRGRLRYHLESCPACAAYLHEVRRQRKLLGVALPVVPALALKDSVMEAAGIGAGSVAAIGVAASGGGGAAGAGSVAASGGAGAAGASAAAGAGTVGAATAVGAAGAGGTLLGGTAVKLVVAGAILAGGAGVVTEVARDGGGPPAVQAPAASGGGGSTGGDVPRADRPGADAPRETGDGRGRGSGPVERALERRRQARGAERRALGRQRARERSGGRSAAGAPRGRALGRSGAPPAGPDGKPGSGGERGVPSRGEGVPTTPARPPGRDTGGRATSGDRGGGSTGGGLSATPPQRSQRSRPPAPTPPSARGDGGASVEPGKGRPRKAYGVPD